jgi:SAM-dependent methyltransferase
VQRAGACAIDVDVSMVMALETRRRRAHARVVMGDAGALPLRDGVAGLVRAERMMQWSAEPARVLAELLRVTAVSGWLAVTDTDWSTFTLEHPDAAVVERFGAGALGWVPHPRLARDMPSALSALGAHDVRLRRDTMTIDAWNPDDRLQHAGPPGLPLRDIGTADDVDVVAERARAGKFGAAVTLVTVVARRA